MAKDLTWIFKLIDRISGPAGKASAAVDKTGASLRRVQETQARVVKATRATGSELAATSSGWATAGLNVMGYLESLRMVGSAAYSAISFVARAQSFKEDTLLGLEVILKSKSEAERVMASAVKFAADTPFQTTQVMSWTKDLLTAGFQPDEAEMLRLVAGDFAALKGADEYADRVIFHMNKLNAVGKLTGETMMQLGEAGLPVGKVYENLAKQFHTTTAGVLKLQEAGRIDSGSAINAIVQTIADLQGGKLGIITQRRSKSLSGLWSTLSSRPEELAMGIGGGGMDKAKSAMQSMADALDPASPSGKRIIESLTRLSDTLTKLFIEPFQGEDGVRRLEVTIRGVVRVIEGVAYVAAGIGWVVERAMSFWDAEVLVINRVMGFWDSSLEVMARGAAFVVGIWDSMTTALKDIGGNLMKGLAWGIENGVQWVLEAIANLASKATAALKDALGIHSPSKVFEGLGLNVAAGFEQGVDGGAAGASSAVEAMVKVPRAGGSGGGFSMAPGAVVVNVSGGGADLEGRVREAVLQALGSAFEQLGLEAGVA